MKPRAQGFILPTLSPTLWGLVGVAVVITGLSVALWARGLQLDKARADLKLERAAFASFQSETARLGREADKAKAATEVQNKQAKEKADAKLTTTLAQLASTRRELRNERTRPGGGLVPPPSPGAEHPERACYDRAELTGALSRFEEGTEGLVGEGAEAVIKLDGVKLWNQERK